MYLYSMEYIYTVYIFLTLRSIDGLTIKSTNAGIDACYYYSMQKVYCYKAYLNLMYYFKKLKPFLTNYKRVFMK